MNLLAALLWWAPVGLPSAVGPPASPETALRGYEYVPPVARPDPVTLAAWRRVAADPQEDPVIRGRALTLLSTTGDPTQAALLRGLMSPVEEPFLRRKALESLARLRGAAILGEVETLYLGAGKDPRFRAACARALATMGQAGAPVRARLRARETHQEIRRLLAPSPLPGRTPP